MRRAPALSDMKLKPSFKDEPLEQTVERFGKWIQCFQVFDYKKITFLLIIKQIIIIKKIIKNILHETSHQVCNEPMKFPSKGKFAKLDGRAIGVMRRASWVQQTTICHSLGFSLWSYILDCLSFFHEGPIFFSTLQNWFITPLYSKNVPIIKPTIARSRAICLSRFTSHTAFETFSFTFLCLTELLNFFSACSFYYFYLTLTEIRKTSSSALHHWG